MTPVSPFAGSWMGGFEGADHVNKDGVALDLVRSSGHLDQLEADHRRAAEAGLACVRESIGWRLSESKDGLVDLDRALRVAQSADRHGLQVLWTVLHYGLPGDLCLHDDALIPRFERFSAHVARVIGEISGTPPVYTPINEIGFLAWMASQSGHLHPPNGSAQPDAESSLVSGYSVKCRLARAAIAAVHAMRHVDPRARFMHVEPVVHVVAPPGANDAAQQAAWSARAAEVSSWQWQAWDLLAGRCEPAMGGSADVLDIVGVNHYHSSQWELLTERRLPWHLRDARRRPMADLMEGVWRRYGRPIVLAETSHVGVGRAAWLHEMACEVRTARQAGVPVQGLCVYPLTDRPDWNEPARWHRSGLWHVAVGAGPGVGNLARVADFDAFNALQAWQSSDARSERNPLLVVIARRRWGSAQRRLQPLVERWAAWWRVVVVEPPRRDEGATVAGWRLDRQPQGPHLDVLVPCYCGDHASAEAADDSRWPASLQLQGLLGRWLVAQRGPGTASLVLLDYPAALPLANALSRHGQGGGVGAPAGCPVLDLQDPPVGVDLARHAASGGVPPGWAQDEARQILEGIGRPRLVCLGPLNADIDVPLLQSLVRSRPHWHVVLIGPTTDATAASLASAEPKVHWIGKQPHALVPALLAACDVGLMPFASDYSSGSALALPIKLLEYLAAGLPVVASNLTMPAINAEALRASGLVCTRGIEEFLDACDAAMKETEDASVLRNAACRVWITPYDWDAVAVAVHLRLLQHLMPTRTEPHSADQHVGAVT